MACERSTNESSGFIFVVYAGLNLIVLGNRVIGLGVPGPIY